MKQPSDSAQRTLDDAVAEFAKATGFTLAFGGFETGGTAHITALFGTRTPSLQGLNVATGLGLGGRAMSEGRPRLTADYSRSTHITHDYDTQVLAEHVQSLFAMPVIVSGTVRAVLYGGTRGGSVPGTVFVQAGARVAHHLAQEIRVEDEVTRRLTQRAVFADPAPISVPGVVREQIRGGHAELRRITATVTDPVLRAQLLALEQRLALACAPESVPSQKSTIRLTPRELDVLSHAALGYSNIEIGASLSLTESTVKSYLKTAMAKLGVSSRHAAVTAARVEGLIP